MPGYSQVPIRSSDGAGDRTPPVALLHEDIVEAFDARGIATEAIDCWARREAEVLRHKGRAIGSRHGTEYSGVKEQECEPPRPLPRPIRTEILRFMHHLCDLAGLGPSAWFDAVLLLDAYRLKGSPSPEELSAACAAIVALLRKNDGTAQRWQTLFAREASQLANCLTSLGFPARAPPAETSVPTSDEEDNQCDGEDDQSTSKVSTEDIRAQECRILTAVDWQINLASVHKWLWTICERFKVILRGRLSPSLDWVFQQGLLSAQAYLQRVDGACVDVASNARPPLPPQRVATGIFCLGLVSARLLPVEALRPEDVGLEEWATLYAKSQWQGAAGTCALPHGHLTMMLEALQVTTRCCAAELQADSHAVAEVMAVIVAEKNAQTGGA